MESDRLLVLYPQKRGPEEERSRMDEVLRAALDGIDAETVEDMEILEQDPFKYRGRRLLFAVPLGRNGINRGYYEVLAWLRGGDQVLAGATAGMIIGERILHESDGKRACGGGKPRRMCLCRPPAGGRNRLPR